jgi:hypothetical protein
MKSIGPFPAFSVWLGIAEDGLPVCINTADEKSPNVVVWDKSARQSLSLLKVVCEYIFTNRHQDGIEFVVLTTHPENYGKLNEYGMGTNSKTSCIGIIPFNSQLSDVVVAGLSRWIHEKHTSAKHPVVILIDGLENVGQMSEDFRNNFQHILDLGRTRNVFVIGTSSKNNFRKVQEWLYGFQVEMYGRDLPNEFEYSQGKKNVIIFYTPKTELL